VLLNAEECGGRKTRILPILRTDAGDFFGFGTPAEVDLAGSSGDTANIFPQEPPSREEQRFARALIMKAGLKGYLPSLPAKLRTHE
jgi:hypothetical protein